MGLSRSAATLILWYGILRDRVYTCRWVTDTSQTASLVATSIIYDGNLRFSVFALSHCRPGVFDWGVLFLLCPVGPQFDNNFWAQ